MSQVNPLNSLFFNVAEGLSQDELEAVERLVKDDQITTRETEKIKTAEDLFTKLKQSGFISETNLTLLKELLETLKRRDLIDRVEAFEAGQQGYGTGSAASEHRKHSPDTQSTTEITASRYPDIALECEKRLKSDYSRLSHILPFPWWDGANRLDLEDVYTELELQTKKGDRRDFARREIFSPKDDGESHSYPKRVLIEGDPGYGKSTFCSKLAYDWAKGTVEYLQCYKLLFSFGVKDLLECDGKNIQDTIFDQLSWPVREEGKRQELWNYIQDNQMNVCFVFDGLDEVPPENLPQYFKEMVQLKSSLLPDCPVIVTSRKIRDKNSKQMYDTQLLIKGFDTVKARSFVKKHINAMNSTGELQTEAKASDFLKELEMSGHKNVLLDFMQSPLNTLMLCNIWMYANRLPRTITELYEEIIDNVVKRYKESHDCNSHFNEEIKEALFLMGQMSFLGLTSRERKVYFSQKDISKNRYIRELGLLTKISGIPSRYGFYHLTFQEYFASLYVAELSTEDRSKLVNAVHLLSNSNSRKYNETLLTFLGGKLKDNVGEIFKIWEEKSFIPDTFFDPRPILYESCCKSTDVIKQCAPFLPNEIKIDFNKMVHESESNELIVNETILQCANSRSERVSFAMSTSDTYAVPMYQKCYKALQKGEKKFDNISVELTFESNAISTGGKNCIDDFTFISNTDCDSRPDLKPVTVHDITLQMPRFDESSLVSIEDTYLHASAIVKALSGVSAKELKINSFPLGNMEFIQDVFGCLSENRLLKAVDVELYEVYCKKSQTITIGITAKFGKFNIVCRMNNMDSKLIDLHSWLLPFASVDNERDSQEGFRIEEFLEHTTKNCQMYNLHFKSIYHQAFLDNFDSRNDNVSIDVNIDCYVQDEIKDGETDMLRNLESVNIRNLALHVHGNYGANTECFYLRAAAIVKALSRVSANEILIHGLPLRNLHFMRDVLSCLRTNSLINGVYMVFHNSYYNESHGKLQMLAEVGKFRQHYEMSTRDFLDFQIVDLHRLLLSFASVHNDRVKLNFGIECDMKEKLKSDITDTLHRLKSVDVTLLSIHITGSGSLKKGEASLYVSNIVKELSQISADNLEFVIEKIPLLNLDLVREVVGGLNSHKVLKSIYLTFGEDDINPFTKYKVKIRANIGTFKTTYLINAMGFLDFELVDLHKLLSSVESVDDEGVSLDVEISCDMKEAFTSSINDTIRKLKSVHIRELTLQMIGSSGFNKEEISARVFLINLLFLEVSADNRTYGFEERAVKLLNLE